MNETLFFAQVILIVGFALGALQLGRTALTTWVVMQFLIANLFVLKQIHLFGCDVTASDAFIVGSLLGLNLMQEYVGQEEAQKTTWICFFFLLFFAVISQLHLLYQPNSYDTTQGAFLAILSPSPRLFFASLAVFFVVQRIDLLFFALLKRGFPTMNFAFRSAMALVASQFLDTLLFGVVGLYGIVGSLVPVVAMSFAIKLIVIGCITSLLRLKAMVKA